MVKVSIIIPTYNRSHSIGKTIQSILNQTYKDFEIIVVDDNSSDDTKDVIQYYIDIDSRIRYLKQETNLGAPAARNTGIKASTGEFLALLDDDDWWHPLKIERQLHVFNKDLSMKVGIVYCGFETVSKDGKFRESRMPTDKGKGYIKLLKSNIIGSPTNLIRRECFEKVGYYDTSLKSCQDWDLWIRISKEYEIDFVPEILAYYYISDKSISQNIDLVYIGHKQIFEKYESEIRKNKSIHCNHLISLGLYAKEKKELHEASYYFNKAFKLKPFNLRIIVHYVPMYINNWHC